MAKPCRRLLAAGSFLLLILLLGGSRVEAPLPRAQAQAAEAFTAVAPLKVYTGVPSHPGLADADPTAGTTGYCVTVQDEDHAGVGANNGFSVTNGVILSTDFFDNGSATTTDDVYCLVAQGTPQTAMPRPPMTLHWTYLDSGLPITADLNVALVTVVLVGINGVVGGVAQVCTEGWDPTFLTGEQSNTPPAPPNPLDVVIAADPPDPSDWTTSPGPPTIDILGVARDGSEWCVNFTASAPVAAVDATLSFYAVYDVNTALDDVLISVTTSEPVEIITPVRPELRHVTRVQGPNQGGQLPTRQVGNPNVVGSRHTACIIPSVPGDSLDPDDIHFSSSDGATASNIDVFTNPASFPNLPGVPAGTLCFSWTSGTTGLQAITATFTASPANPANTTGSPKTFAVSWDSDGDGNDVQDKPGGPLVKAWDTIDHTVITTSGKIDEGVVTNSAIVVPVQYNVADNTFLVGNGLKLTEWVVGTRPSRGATIMEPIDGVELVIAIEGSCGYFADTGFLTTLSGENIVTVDGRFDFTIDIANDPGCGAGSTINLRVEARYPSAARRDDFVEVETLDISFSFFPVARAPIVAWVGQTVLLDYSFAGSCDEDIATFTRPEGQPGGFVPGDDPISVGASQATAAFIDCVSNIQYESEIPGEVDVTAVVGQNHFSKVVFTIIFLSIEDIVLTTNEELIISEEGHLEAAVRGWFKNDNPSGRPAETKDGRKLPEDRWILPDDWDLLRGPDGFNHAWPGNAPVPPLRVTFFMESEARVNNYRAGIKDGALGFIFPDTGTEIFYNVNPETGEPSALGTEDLPRILTDGTEPSGKTSVATFGDFNASFEGCAANAPTGNPHCLPGDLVGHTRYYALADYPEIRGKQPPVRSNTAVTAWLWAGYKQLTVVDTPDPTVKYVVAHLRDRDGFCDAISFNNVLGIRIQFQIDAGDGIITGVEARPSEISAQMRAAVGTTFDTHDDFGNPIHTDIAQPTIAPDECQAWIKVNNSLPTPVDVLVRFPPPPSPVPGEIRITRFSCGLLGSVTLTNRGPNLVSLAGFALRSRPPGAFFLEEEHLGLDGLLKPGESVTISGAPEPWLNSGSGPVFGDAPNDYARLVWNGFELAAATCAGDIFAPPIPATLPLDGEGEIQLSITVPFGEKSQVPLVRGWNLVTIGSGTVAIEEAAGESLDLLGIVYAWDAGDQAWLYYAPDGPPSLNTITTFEPGMVYWVYAKEPFTLTVPK